jgi:hypothetical protein
VIAISRIISYAGLLAAWVGVWMSLSTMAAAVMTGASLLLIGGSFVMGLRRRRADGRLASREDAQRNYAWLRASFMWNRALTPVICVMILIYIDFDSTLARALVVGGLLVSVLAGVPGERQTLARARERAGGISDGQTRFRLVEHDPGWDTEGYPNRFVEALDRYPAQATFVTLGVFGVFLGALAAIAHFV